MEVDRLAPGDPFFYYKQTEGHDVLLPTFQSSEQITPMQFPQRPTVSTVRYDQYLETAPKIPRTPWGIEREYGGAGTLNLPDDHRPKDGPPTLMGKGHRHFGYGGYTLPGDVVIDQYYDVTQLKKSRLRPTDQLLPSAAEFALDQKQIQVPFPTEHPYYSHISKFAVFPNFLSPNDPHTGVRAGQLLPINPDMPAKSHDVTVTKKIKGFPYRYEIQKMPTQPKGIAWPGQEGYSQYPKSSKEQKQIYPTPPKLIAPNRPERSIENILSERSANILRNIEKSHWLTTYKREFTGSGPMNPIELDDYIDKTIAKVTGKFDYFTELKEQSHPAFMPNPPLRPLKEKVSCKKVCTDDDIDYQYPIAPPTSPSAPAHDSFHAKSQLPICETDPKPSIETVTCKDKENLKSWQNRRCHTAMSASISCPDYDMHLLRYKVQQMKDYDKPCAFYQHQAERMMDCWATPVLSVDPACRIPDLEHAQSLWKRPKSVQDGISYIDLPQSKLFGFTSNEKHMALSRPARSRVENDEENAKCHKEVNFASGDTRANCISYASGNEELFESMQQPQVGKADLLICDDPKLQVSKLKFPYGFNKTDVHRHLDEIAPEKNMDYRENIFSGRRHTFFGLNSSYFHNGTL
ncbi:uncharacterized protein C7orf31 [Scyliorhinus canicula]|uniref:uncharacterized protein C7orf31 n=1 Tax=Scyliorhinus canicula TaxID=7830 RepID=UPI0018F3603B|nr:uncharacterized protein C7orf31 [Scyliorhinus canicula]